MEKKKITMTGVNETLFVPLYARALESRKPNHAFYDATAVKVIDSLDYNFEKHGKNKMNMWGCAARTIIYDEECNKFINANPDCTVINIACGLDDRFRRVDNGKIRWYNIDFQNVIELREELIEKNERVTDISCSALDFSWVDKIENKENVLVIAEGFLMYLTEAETKELFTEISRRFKNVTLLIELMTKWMVDNQKLHDTTKNTNVTFKFGVEKTSDFCKMCPMYKMTGEYNFTDKMKVFAPVFITLISPVLRKKNNRLGVFKKL